MRRVPFALVALLVCLYAGTGFAESKRHAPVDTSATPSSLVQEGLLPGLTEDQSQTVLGYNNLTPEQIKLHLLERDRAEIEALRQFSEMLSELKVTDKKTQDALKTFENNVGELLTDPEFKKEWLKELSEAKPKLASKAEAKEALPSSSMPTSPTTPPRPTPFTKKFFDQARQLGVQQTDGPKALSEVISKVGEAGREKAAEIVRSVYGESLVHTLKALRPGDKPLELETGTTDSLMVVAPKTDGGRFTVVPKSVYQKEMLSRQAQVVASIKGLKLNGQDLTASHGFELDQLSKTDKSKLEAVGLGSSLQKLQDQIDTQRIVETGALQQETEGEPSTLKITDKVLSQAEGDAKLREALDRQANRVGSDYLLLKKKGLLQDGKDSELHLNVPKDITEKVRADKDLRLALDRQFSGIATTALITEVQSSAEKAALARDETDATTFYQTGQKLQPQLALEAEKSFDSANVGNDLPTGMSGELLGSLAALRDFRRLEKSLEGQSLSKAQKLQLAETEATIFAELKERTHPDRASYGTWGPQVKQGGIVDKVQEQAPLVERRYQDLLSRENLYRKGEDKLSNRITDLGIGGVHAKASEGLARMNADSRTLKLEEDQRKKLALRVETEFDRANQGQTILQASLPAEIYESLNSLADLRRLEKSLKGTELSDTQKLLLAETEHLIFTDLREKTNPVSSRYGVQSPQTGGVIDKVEKFVDRSTDKYRQLLDKANEGRSEEERIPHVPQQIMMSKVALRDFIASAEGKYLGDGLTWEKLIAEAGDARRNAIGEIEGGTAAAYLSLFNPFRKKGNSYADLLENELSQMELNIKTMKLNGMPAQGTDPLEKVVKDLRQDFVETGNASAKAFERDAKIAAAQALLGLASVGISTGLNAVAGVRLVSAVGKIDKVRSLRLAVSRADQVLVGNLRVKGLQPVLQSAIAKKGVGVALLGRVAVGSTMGAGVAGTMDEIVQAAEIADGVSSGYDPKRSLAAVGTGAVMGGVLGATGNPFHVGDGVGAYFSMQAAAPIVDNASDGNFRTAAAHLVGGEILAPLGTHLAAVKAPDVVNALANKSGTAVSGAKPSSSLATSWKQKITSVKEYFAEAFHSLRRDLDTPSDEPNTIAAEPAPQVVQTTLPKKHHQIRKAWPINDEARGTPKEAFALHRPKTIDLEDTVAIENLSGAVPPPGKAKPAEMPAGHSEQRYRLVESAMRIINQRANWLKDTLVGMSPFDLRRFRQVLLRGGGPHNLAVESGMEMANPGGVNAVLVNKGETLSDGVLGNKDIRKPHMTADTLTTVGGGFPDGVLPMRIKLTLVEFAKFAGYIPSSLVAEAATVSLARSSVDPLVGATVVKSTPRSAIVEARKLLNDYEKGQLVVDGQRVEQLHPTSLATLEVLAAQSKDLHLWPKEAAFLHEVRYDDRPDAPHQYIFTDAISVGTGLRDDANPYRPRPEDPIERAPVKKENERLVDAHWEKMSKTGKSFVEKVSKLFKATGEYLARFLEGQRAIILGGGYSSNVAIGKILEHTPNPDQPIALVTRREFDPKTESANVRKLLWANSDILIAEARTKPTVKVDKNGDQLLTFIDKNKRTQTINIRNRKFEVVEEYDAYGKTLEENDGWGNMVEKPRYSIGIKSLKPRVEHYVVDDNTVKLTELENNMRFEATGKDKNPVRLDGRLVTSAGQEGNRDHVEMWGLPKLIDGNGKEIPLTVSESVVKDTIDFGFGAEPQEASIARSIDSLSVPLLTADNREFRMNVPLDNVYVVGPATNRKAEGGGVLVSQKQLESVKSLNTSSDSLSALLPGSQALGRLLGKFFRKDNSRVEADPAPDTVPLGKLDTRVSPTSFTVRGGEVPEHLIDLAGEGAPTNKLITEGVYVELTKFFDRMRVDRNEGLHDGRFEMRVDRIEDGSLKFSLSGLSAEGSAKLRQAIESDATLQSQLEAWTRLNDETATLTVPFSRTGRFRGDLLELNSPMDLIARGVRQGRTPQEVLTYLTGRAEVDRQADEAWVKKMYETKYPVSSNDRVEVMTFIDPQSNKVAFKVLRNGKEHIAVSEYGHVNQIVGLKTIAAAQAINENGLREIMASSPIHAAQARINRRENKGTYNLYVFYDIAGTGAILKANDTAIAEPRVAAELGKNLAKLHSGKSDRNAFTDDAQQWAAAQETLPDDRSFWSQLLGPSNREMQEFLQSEVFQGKLVHGDLRTENIAVGDRGVTLAAVSRSLDGSHPLADLKQVVEQYDAIGEDPWPFVNSYVKNSALSRRENQLLRQWVARWSTQSREPMEIYVPNLRAMAGSVFEPWLEGLFGEQSEVAQPGGVPTR
jgi:hypothetical protein